MSHPVTWVYVTPRAIGRSRLQAAIRRKHQEAASRSAHGPRDPPQPDGPLATPSVLRTFEWLAQHGLLHRSRSALCERRDAAGPAGY